MAHLGQDLKHEREIRGISLRQIADSTRISLRYLEALENERFEVIPGRFFVRAILRSYALALGLEENRFLKPYDESTAFNEQLEYMESGSAQHPSRHGVSRRATAAVALASVAAGAVLIYVFVIVPRRAHAPASKPRVRTETKAPAAVVPAAPVTIPAAPTAETPAPATTAPAKPARAVEEIKGLVLDISFTEDTWLQIYADGQSAWGGIKHAGESLEVRAIREFLLYTGNCGGMSSTLNNKKMRPFGQRGEVRKDVRITLDNYKEYLLPEGTG